MFFLNVLVSGLLAGLMYAMVAIGFLLIYKASGVFNFAEGTMVFFAALTFVVLNEHGLPFWAAFPITALVMIIGAVLISWVLGKPIEIRPLLISKLNTAAQILFAGSVLAAQAFGLTLSMWFDAGLAIVAGLTLASTAVYLAQWLRHMSS